MDHNSSSGKHLLIMLACCMIPLAILGAVLFLKVDLGSMGLFAIMLLCPLMHIFMMRGMGHDHGKEGQACHGEPSRQAGHTSPAGDAPETVAQKSS